jgi:non-ribosomal peptide synthetase component F
MFWRAPTVDGVERIVGEFSNVLILSVDLRRAPTLAQLCAQLSAQMSELLSHASYPGVNLMRDLSRHHGSLQHSPVVFTAGLDLPGGDLFSPRVTRTFGKLSWAVSQGPQVALDAQVAALDGGMLINWDVRLDILPRAWIEALFDAYVDLVRRVASSADQLAQPSRQPDLTQQMLLGLLARLSRRERVDADSELANLSLDDAALADLLGFIDRYIPTARLSPGDLREQRTPARLAELIRARSQDASEQVAQALLQALQRAG